VRRSGKYKELEMYFYQMISRADENPTERQLAEGFAEAVAIKLQSDDVPQIYFIEESSAGYIKYSFRINGYCSVDGRYLCVRRGLTSKTLVETAIHEARHSFQVRDPKLRMCSDKIREQDAEIFVREFFGNHDRSGDASTLMRTLNAILQEDLDRLWKQACTFARAQLSKPTNTQESDQLRRQFAPVIKARSLAVQKFIDPSGRQLFPSDIEFSSPCASLKLSY
jgi:hypothetical protein